MIHYVWDGVFGYMENSIEEVENVGTRTSKKTHAYDVYRARNPI